MFKNYYQAEIFAKERSEQFRREVQHFQQVKEARAARAAERQNRKEAFIAARGWVANANQ